MTHSLRNKPQDMTKDEIYEHLAKVYMGKRETQAHIKKKPSLNFSFAGRVFLTIVVLTISFYGFTAFYFRRDTNIKNQMIFNLNTSLVRVKYDLSDPYPKVKQFSLQIPPTDLSQFHKINFSIRSTKDGSPGIVKVVLRNQKNEMAYYFARDIDFRWKTFSVALVDFKGITDWSNLKDVSFVLEEWNLEDEKGVILIDNVNFSS